MIHSLAVFGQLLRAALLAVGLVVCVVAALDWAARTRRLNPFSGIARFLRARVDPRLAGIERLVLRAGGHQSATPGWAVLAYVVAGLLLIAFVDLVRGLLVDATTAASLGARGVLWLVVDWAFGFLIIALMVRVLTSWIPPLAWSRWTRWSHRATEWMLRPLRRILPAFGPVDITPIIAYFALTFIRYLVETVIIGGIR